MAAAAAPVALRAGAQAPVRHARHAPQAVARLAPDPEIASALASISPDRVRRDVERLVGFHTRQTLSAGQPASSGRGIAAAREWIKSELESYSRSCGGCLEVRTDAFVQPPSERVPQPTEIVNVYAVLRGDDPQERNRIFLVTGHYDSRNSDTFDARAAAPGANDDASGTAVSLECARLLSRRRFPATLVSLAVAGEEQGLYGSKHFAEMARRESWQLEAVLNNDIVGGDRSPGQNRRLVRVFSEGIPATAVGDQQQVKIVRALGAESDSPSRQLARYIAQVGQEYLPASFQPALQFRPDRFLRGGDHLSFNQLGFPAVRFTEYRENFDHQHQDVRTANGVEYGDLPRFVDFDYVANVARLNAATLAELASAPAPPANPRVLTRKLENGSTLVWEPSPGGRASAYEVLWRETTAPLWQQVRPIGRLLQVTLPVSKDNVFFGVRAVDDAGHRSIAVVPAPER